MWGGTELAKQFVQIQIGGDQAFLLGVGKAVIERDDEAARGSDATTVRHSLGTVIDSLFVGAHTDNFGAWRAHVHALSWATLVERSGVDEATMRNISNLYIDAKSVIACWAMGLT